jgi:MFS family permease
METAMLRGSFLLENAPWLGAGVLLMFLSSFGQTFFISVFAGHFQDSFGLSHGEWGSLYAIGTTASAIAMVWAGVLADRVNTRRLGSLCLVGLGLACVLTAINAYAVLVPVVIFFLRFAGQGMASHIALVSVSRWFVATRGKALAIASLGYSLGEIVLPVSFVFLMGFFDWRLLWGFAGIVVLLATFVLRSLLKTDRVPAGSDAQDIQVGMLGKHWSRPDVMRHSLFWFVLPAIIGLPAFGTAFLFHQVHFAELKQISHLSFVAMLPIYSVTAIGAMVVSGIALDRFGTPALFPYYLLPSAAAFLVAGLTQTPVGLAVSLVFFGLTTGSSGTLTSALWAEVYGTQHIGAIKALAAGLMVLGSALGPALTGGLIDAGIGLEAQYIAISAYMVLASILVWMGVRQIEAPVSASA